VKPIELAPLLSTKKTMSKGISQCVRNVAEGRSKLPLNAGKDLREKNTSPLMASSKTKTARASKATFRELRNPSGPIPGKFT
jgi:hypothetical protein